ncbi:hypothetical protein Ctob_010364 [Chrysochromulina tobinii]|uniref:RING-type domain-containing protein n=1 Tax=Chrysochromulina tobinii TaxID=1460289 RepID=A0A0M0JF21_9EUKA|nr:hypothetical protein Ctob_010364 [Chrysochromulina tobinii]|eukprot:KOO25189.1 hypothetical protein Ctob_010364 [Chrysochromulina sp. CCMP291]
MRRASGAWSSMVASTRHRSRRTERRATSAASRRRRRRPCATRGALGRSERRRRRRWQGMKGRSRSQRMRPGRPRRPRGWRWYPPVPAPPTPIEVEQAEALRCWRLLLTAMRDDHRSQQGSSSSSALPPPSPAAMTKHASRKRPAVAVALEVGVPRAEALQPQLTAKSGDDPGAARCVICLEALNLSSASASSRGEAACGHTPCCGNYFHKRCLSQWLQGSRQSGSPLPIEKKCPTCRRDLVARALIPWALPTAPLHECK